MNERAMPMSDMQGNALILRSIGIGVGTNLLLSKTKKGID
jgi:hypothetical protein